MGVNSKSTARRAVLLLWLLVAVYYFYLAFDYVRVEMNNEKLGEYVRYVAQIAGRESRSAREVRALLLVRADELGVPLRSEPIKIQGRGNDLKIQLQYDIDIDVPILRDGFYSKHYVHDASYRAPK
jgi:hypothetical protein